MTHTCFRTLVRWSGVAAIFAVLPLLAADSLTPAQQEEFLRTAKITKAVPAKKGITGTIRVTLTDGKVAHDASVQTIDERKMVFQGGSGTTELNFKDTYQFNIAAWKLAHMLGLDDMVPVSVNRGYRGKPASFTWWIDNVIMDEADRVHKKLKSPDPNKWNDEVAVMHVFDQLIYNTDSNATNLLIDNHWNIWLVDHSRAFRLQKSLQDRKLLTRCDRQLLAKMKLLDEATLENEMKPYLERNEIQALLARRDLMVKLFEAKGASALYDRPVRP